MSDLEQLKLESLLQPEENIQEDEKQNNKVTQESSTAVLSVWAKINRTADYE